MSNKTAVPKSSKILPPKHPQDASLGCLLFPYGPHSVKKEWKNVKSDAPQSAESLFRELMEHAPRESNPLMYETYMLAVRTILNHPEWKESFLHLMEKAPEYQMSYVAYIHTILIVLQKS